MRIKRGWWAVAVLAGVAVWVAIWLVLWTVLGQPGG